MANRPSSNSPPPGLKFIRPGELPYITFSPFPSYLRAVPILPYFDPENRRFEMYVPQADGTLLVVHPADYANGIYIGREPATPGRDAKLSFSYSIVQHLNYKDVIDAEHDVYNDVIGMLACFHKYFILLDYYNSRPHDFTYTAVMQNEIAAVLANHRAFYDRLHNIVIVIHGLLAPKSSAMPDSFRKMVERPPAELAKKYGLPDHLATFYEGRSAVFSKLRAIRDNIFHHGHTLPGTVYRFPDGFALAIDGVLPRKLDEFSIWPLALLKPNGLGSLLGLYAFVAGDMFDSLAALGSALLFSLAELPAPVAAGHNLYLRSELAMHMWNWDRYRHEHWFVPGPILAGEVWGRQI
jgi:hypothetical protein